MLIIALLVPSVAVYAEEKPNEDDSIRENLSIVENELYNEGTDVSSELNDMIDYYNDELDKASSDEERTRINDLLDSLSTLLIDYENSQGKVNSSRASTGGYTAAIAAVIAYFNANGYVLAAELLTFASNNTMLNMYYTPQNGKLVLQSSVFRNIAHGTSTSGTNAFPNSGGTVDKDLYYAIHSFSYSKASAKTKTVTINDRYDFAKGKYSGIAGIAIDTMYKAQQAGYLTPFYVRIVATCP
jgi:hypothetical protein